MSAPKIPAVLATALGRVGRWVYLLPVLLLLLFFHPLLHSSPPVEEVDRATELKIYGEAVAMLRRSMAEADRRRKGWGRHDHVSYLFHLKLFHYEKKTGHSRSLVYDVLRRGLEEDWSGGRDDRLRLEFHPIEGVGW